MVQSLPKCVENVTNITSVLQISGVAEDDRELFLLQHSVAQKQQIQRHEIIEHLKEHPEYQRLVEWKKRHQVSLRPK
jgi:hypothetical protein